MRRYVKAFATAYVLATILAIAGASGASAEPKSIAGFIDGGLGPAHLRAPAEVAVFTGGDSSLANDKLFVVEGGSDGSRVQRLDVHGNFELMWGRDAISAGAPGDTGTGHEVCAAEPDCQSSDFGEAEGELRNAVGVAVNQATGHVYVADSGNYRIQEFDLDGNFVRLWGGGVSTGADAGEICTSVCGPGFAGTGNGQFGDGMGIAVDPVDGDVLVADPGNSRIQRFSSEGAFESAFGTAGSGPGAGELGPGEPQRIAVDSNQVVYASDTNQSGRIQRYDSQAETFLTPIPCCAPTPGAPLLDGVTVGLEVDADTDGAGADEERLLVVRNRTSSQACLDSRAATQDRGDPAVCDTVIQELDIPAVPSDPFTAVDEHTYGAAAPGPNANTHDRVATGIGVNPVSGYVYLVTPNILAALESGDEGTFTGCEVRFCSGLLVFALDPGPVAGALVAADPEATSASITGSAHAGVGAATYRFQLSTGPGENWQDAGRQGYVSGAEDVPVTGDLTGLQPNTLYRVRMVVRKQTGYSTAVSEISNELTFVTDVAPPDAQTLGTSQRTDTSVQLRGRVDPNGLPTTYWFEYGRAGGPLNGRIPVPDASAGSGNVPTVFAEQLDGLDPETDYAYRIVASSEEGGTSHGNVVGFRTERATGPLELTPRGYELVSPADKESGVGVGPWYSGPAASALVGLGAHEGERFAVQGYLGSVLVDGPYTYSNDWALAERTPSGWVSRPGISRRAHGTQAKADISLNAAAENLSLMTWGSGGHTLKLFPEMEPWDEAISANVLMMRQWTSDGWELFGPTDLAQVVDPIDTLGDAPKAVAADGSAVVVSASSTRGLAGPGDPTSLEFPDLEPGRDSVYLDEITGEFSDDFPGDDGIRTLVNVCSDETDLPARLGSKQAAVDCPDPDFEGGRDARLISSRGATLTVDGSTDGVISADGSRVFFMSPDAGAATGCSGIGADSACPPQLFVWRRNSDGSVTTQWISRTDVTAANGAAADQDASLMAPVSFQGSSRDGDKVFFRTISPLTADDRNGSGAPPAGGITTGSPNAQSGDLFMYDLPDGPDSDPAGGDLVRISAGPDGSSDCNTPSSTLRFVSDDGSRAYFTCAAPLTGMSAPGSGTTTTPGGTRSSTDAVNLYVYDTTRPDAQRWRFIARLPSGGGLAACATMASESCVNGTSDGSLVTFMTSGALTSDEPPTDQSTGDVFGYDALRDELSRLSASQGGVPGAPYPCAPSSLDQCHGDRGITDRELALERLGVASRPLGGDPRGDRLAFFQSQAQLVPEDRDSAYDVYQWRALDGRLSLLSTGVSDSHDAMFVGNDRSALNVYLATRDRLTWQDTDAVLDVYTARIGGGIPQPPGPPRCDTLGDACQAPGAPPRDARINSDQSQATPAAGRRMRVSLRRISAKARRRAARTGVLAVRVKVSQPGLLTLSARARIGGKARKVAGARRRLTKAGTVTVRMRLRRVARRRLDAGRPLRLAITASVSSGAATRTIGVTLRKRSGR